MEQKPIKPTTKNIRCIKCHKWIRIPGWVRSKPMYGSTKTVMIRCPHCKAYNEVAVEF